MRKRIQNKAYFYYKILSLIVFIVVAVVLTSCNRIYMENSIETSGKYTAGDNPETDNSTADYEIESEPVSKDERASQYENALCLFNNEKYNEAKEIFEIISDYKDCADYLKQCNINIRYEEAFDLFIEGDYEAAKTIFLELGDFEYSADFLEECNTEIKYKEAIELLNNGDYEAAETLFLELDDFKDSISYLHQCYKMRIEDDYKKAVVLYNEGKYGEAEELFYNLIYDAEDEQYAESFLDDCNNYRKRCLQHIDHVHNYSDGLQCIYCGKFDTTWAQFTMDADYDRHFYIGNDFCYLHKNGFQINEYGQCTVTYDVYGGVYCVDLIGTKTITFNLKNPRISISSYTSGWSDIAEYQHESVRYECYDENDNRMKGLSLNFMHRVRKYDIRKYLYHHDLDEYFKDYYYELYAFRIEIKETYKGVVCDSDIVILYGGVDTPIIMTNEKGTVIWKGSDFSEAVMSSEDNYRICVIDEIRLVNDVNVYYDIYLDGIKKIDFSVYKIIQKNENAHIRCSDKEEYNILKNHIILLN